MPLFLETDILSQATELVYFKIEIACEIKILQSNLNHHQTKIETSIEKALST